MTSPLRRTFDEDAELYDRARPGYGDDIVDPLVARAGLARGSRVLEIAPGTGQLTVPLAARGLRVTAVELGPAMAAVARRNLAAVPGADARVETAEFETWRRPGEPFDAVAVATAFHWIDPARRVALVADALRPGGTFALIRNHHVAGGSAAFFTRVQALYTRWDPANTEPGLALTEAADLPPDTAELDDSGLFDPAVVTRHPVDIDYTADRYLDVLRTYSGHRAMPADRREGLLADIAALIDRDFGGRITKRYLRELVTARRRPAARRAATG